MASPFVKSVVISAAHADAPVAARLKEILIGHIGESVWVRDFDLNAGSLALDAIELQITDARWLVLLYTTDAVKSKWVQVEAHAATMRAIEESDFRIIVLRLDDTPLAFKFQMAFRHAELIDVTKAPNRDEEFGRLAQIINRTDSTKSQQIVYVGRGVDSDKISLSLRRNRFVFVLGWAGVGKTAFVEHSISLLLGKRPFSISLSRGHSLDLLCRQVLQAAHMPQPVGTPESDISDAYLLAAALDGIKSRSDQFFVFLDNAETGLDPSNRLFPYLERFLEAFLKADLKTHVVLATSRNPDLAPLLGGATDVFPLGGLQDVYIRECLDLWLQDSPRHDAVIHDPQLNDVVQVIGGHPLAAKMVASFLKVQPISRFLLPDESRRFQLKLADYMLRVNDLKLLNDIHHLILTVLAAIKHPATLNDLLAVKRIRESGVGVIQDALGQLRDWFLLEQDGELLYLHKFIEAYYADRGSQDLKLLRSISSDFGNYAYARALKSNEQLQASHSEGGARSEKSTSLSNEVFRYALSADRLLRSIGENLRAEQLPIQVRGTLREMVFYFYQEAHDYKTALSYADRWLALNPNDLDIILYQARCYRNLGGADNLALAERTIGRLERVDYRKRFWERILREKALIAQARGDNQKAKLYFMEGTQMNRAHAYPDNHIGLAQLLLHEIDDLPPDDPEKRQGAVQALKYLEEARRESAVFDRFHLGIYVEALIQAGREDKAMPLLEEALAEKPEDSRLNYRMAEVLRNRDEFDAAEPFARRAAMSGAEKARLSLANIRHGQGLREFARNNQRQGEVLIREGLHALAAFRPEFGTDQEVADSITAKLHRALGEWENSRTAISKYIDSRNPYTVYELTKIAQQDADIAEGSGSFVQAMAALDKGIARVLNLRATRELPQPLADLLLTLEGRSQQIKERMSNT